MRDLLLQGGTVLDGTGGPAVTADVAVESGVIVGVGMMTGESARRVLDVSGAVVCPGFVDLHSHADYTFFSAPEAHTQVHQGVTSLVTGNCGFSPFPVVDDHVDDIRKDGALSDDALPWDWRTSAEFLAAVERLPLAVNVACLVGHGSLRLAAMGHAQGAPTAEQLDRMRRFLREAVDAGVVGLSSGLIYAPGSFATRAELVELCQGVAEAGLLYASHIRDEGSGLGEAVEEALDTAREARARLEISHLKSIGPANWGGVNTALASIEAARSGGVDVGTDVYPYTASSTTLTSRLPDWTLDGGVPALMRRLEDPATSVRIADEISASSGRTFLPEAIVVAEIGAGPYAHFVGRSIAQIATQLCRDAAATVLELLRAHSGSVRIVNHSMSEDDVQAVIRHPLASIASDGHVLAAHGSGMPHPRSFGTFTRALGRYVRDLGVLDLAEAVRKMTSLPASRLGWRNRGAIRPGAVADLCVFDPASVTDRSTFDDPWRLSTGVFHTIVAGQPVLEDGQPTDARPGHVLRGRAAK